MDIQSLEYFIKVGEINSLTDAAEKLYITQPALSTSIKKLENELGVKLFSREKNRLKLNENGMILWNYAKKICDDVDKMQKMARQLANKESVLRIGFATPTIMWFCIPSFKMQYDVEVEYSVEETMTSDMLTSEQFDILVSAKCLENKKINYMKFLDEQIYASIPESHLHSDRTEISLLELNHEKIILRAVGGHNVNLIISQLQKKCPDCLITLEEPVIAQRLLRQSDSVGFLSSQGLKVRDDGAHRKILPLIDPEFRFSYNIFYVNENRKKVAPFLQWAETYKTSEIV